MDQNFIAMIECLLAQQTATQEKLVTTLMEKFDQKSERAFGEFKSALARQYTTAVAPRPTPKINIPDFYGNPGDDISTWLFQAEQGLVIYGHDETTKAVVGGSHLKGNALQWYRTVAANGVPSWRVLKEGLLETFRPGDFQVALRERLVALKQKGKIGEYVSQFRALTNQIPEMSEAEKLFFFHHGLSAKTQTLLVAVGPKTTEAATVAHKIESMFQKSVLFAILSSIKRNPYSVISENSMNSGHLTNRKWRDGGSEGFRVYPVGNGQCILVLGLLGGETAYGRRRWEGPVHSGCEVKGHGHTI